MQPETQDAGRFEVESISRRELPEHIPEEATPLVTPERCTVLAIRPVLPRYAFVVSVERTHGLLQRITQAFERATKFVKFARGHGKTGNIQEGVRSVEADRGARSKLTVRISHRSFDRFRLRCRRLKMDRKSASSALLALNRDPRTHHLQETLRDRQTDAVALV